MNYVKIENGQVTQQGLPTSGLLTQAGFEGCAVSGYDLLPYTSDNPEEPTLQKEGWLPVVDNPPAYDLETQYLEQVGYTIGVENVVVNYVINQIEVIVPEPTPEERIAQLEAERTALQDKIALLEPAVDFLMLEVVPILFP